MGTSGVPGTGGKRLLARPMTELDNSSAPPIFEYRFAVLLQYCLSGSDAIFVAMSNSLILGLIVFRIFFGVSDLTFRSTADSMAFLARENAFPFKVVIRSDTDFPF
jgi:hypothetical protein